MPAAFFISTRAISYPPPTPLPDHMISLLLRAEIATSITTGFAAVLASALSFIAKSSGYHGFVSFIAPTIPILSAWGFIGIISIFTGVVLKIDKWKVQPPTQTSSSKRTRNLAFFSQSIGQPPPDLIG